MAWIFMLRGTLVDMHLLKNWQTVSGARSPEGKPARLLYIFLLCYLAK